MLADDKWSTNMKERTISTIVLLLSMLFSTLVVADDIYHCVGKYNTGADYDHVYTVNKSIGNDTLSWEGQEFEIHSGLRPVRLYATYVGDTGVDVLFIDYETLRAKFSSIRYGTQFFASGSCKKRK